MDKATLLGARKRRERTQNGIKKEIYHIPLQSPINQNLNYYSNITCRLRLRNEFESHTRLWCHKTTDARWFSATLYQGSRWSTRKPIVQNCAPLWPLGSHFSANIGLRKKSQYLLPRADVRRSEAIILLQRRWHFFLQLEVECSRAVFQSFLSSAAFCSMCRLFINIRDAQLFRWTHCTQSESFGRLMPGSRGSSVSLVSYYGLDDRAIDVRSPASVSRPDLRPTQPPVQWVLGVLSPGVKRGWGVTLTTHPNLLPRSWMSRSYTSPP
jgi:hypothetical protein